MTSFSLITTGHAQTLPQSGAVLLLGGWCDPLGQLVNRADIKLKIAKPYGLKKYEKDRDYALCKKIKDDVFPHFCEILNFHLEKSFEERAWNIILGHWFFRMTSILINRYSSLRQCLDNYSVDQILALSHPDFNLGCEDTYTQILHF